MVIWSESLDRIIPLCQDFEDRLIKLLWRSRPIVNAATATATSASKPTSVAGSAAGSYYHGAPGGNGNRASTGGTVSEAELVDHSGGSVGGHGYGEATRPPRGSGVVRGL